MIVDAILDWWFGLCDWIISLLPDNPLPHGVDLGWIQDINYFLPVSEMFGLFTTFFALGGPLVGSSLIIWLIVGVVRGGSTKA